MMTHESKNVAEPYLSIVEAAQSMAVHPSTIRRWIDQGIVPAYRLGRRRLGVRPDDLAKIVTLRTGERPTWIQSSAAGHRSRMTPEEKQQALKAMEELFRAADELAARHGGKFEPESWVLIDEAREQRTRELMSEAGE